MPNPIIGTPLVSNHPSRIKLTTMALCAHKIMLGACDVDVVGCFPCRDKPADQGGVVIAGCV